MAETDNPHQQSPYWQAFRAHVNSARRRGIAFHFDFESWVAWWLTDDRWLNRGLHRGCFVMARLKDVGPYSPSNVYCATVQQNLRDIPKPVREKAAAKASATLKANPDLKVRQRGFGHPRSQAVKTPRGVYGSAALAAEAFGITRQGAANRARQRFEGWSYCGNIMERKA